MPTTPIDVVHHHLNFAGQNVLSYGSWVLTDNERTQQRAERLLRPYFCLRAGRRFDADASILPPLAVAA